VLPEKVSSLAETAERAEDIDVARAQAANQRADEELHNPGPAGNPEADTALRRASARIDVASRGIS